MNNKVNLADIRAFVLTAKAGSFTCAAELLSCSRSHVSKQLLQLETTLGVKLITRTTRTQRLTDQGKVFFDQCERSLMIMDQAIEQVIDSAKVMKGSLKINCVGGYIGEEIITPLINDFIRKHSEVRVNLNFASKRVNLISGEFDLVFRMGHLEDSNLIARKVLDIAIVTVASPKYLQQYGYPNRPEDLKKHQCITGSVTHWSFNRIDKAAEEVDIAVTGSFQCKNGRAMVTSALAGNGIVRVPALYCMSELENGLLVPIFDTWQVPEIPLYLVYLQDKHQPERLKAFIEFACENVSKYIPALLQGA